MKTFIFSALALGVMAGCSNTEIEDVVDSGEPVAITLNAGVETAVVVGTRAAIGTDELFKATVLGWEGDNVADYKVAPTWTAISSDIKASSEVTNNITLTNTQYYKSDGTHTFMKAFYVNGETPVADTDSWIYNLTKKDGTLDILMASAINGDKNTPAASFAFKRPLTKLIFKVVAGDGLADNVTLTSIEVKDMCVPEKINLGTDEVVFGETLATPLSIGVTASTSITATETPVGHAIMVKPIAGTFVMSVTTSTKTYDNVTVTLNSVAEHLDGAGVAYTVTLTFKEQISVSASVADWSEGTGSATIG